MSMQSSNKKAARLPKYWQKPCLNWSRVSSSRSPCAGIDSGVAFSRPIRWYVALLGDQVIPFEYAGVVAGNTSRGLRPYDSPEIKIPSADKYFDVIREAGIVSR